MAILISAHELSKSFASRPLFENITFSLESGERIGLIGPNGAGKSTLLRILAGKIQPDAGSLSVPRGLNVAFLEQVPLFQSDATIESTLFEGVRDADDWQDIARVQETLAKLSLNGVVAGIAPESPVAALSGGWKKRVALGRELVKNPDLLLLDEPTNHLDVESILWLENLLAEARFATLTITHDRYFLQRVSNRILELDRRNPRGLLSVAGDYAKYVETKASMMAAQESRETKLRNTLRRETEWLRQGAKARTTKQQARIQRAHDLGGEVAELAYRNRAQEARLDFIETERNPKKLVSAEGISKSYGCKPVVPATDLLLTPRSRVGLLGPNGCGKSTLIRLLLGEESPDTGGVFRSENLKVAYFEQNRDSLDPELSVLRTVCPLGEHVDLPSGRVHVRSYLERFLFSAQQAEMPVGKLSGGEQSRLLLALLMMHEANLLVLDEPTNDLDRETLDILEDVLLDFNGAVLLVTHDRYFMDQVANKIIAFGKNESGAPKLESFANISQWLGWYEAEQEKARRLRQSAKKPSGDAAVAAPPAKKRKLSFKEQREFDAMEATIEAAEVKLADLERESMDPAVATDASRLAALTTEIAATQAEVERLYARWAELSG